MKQIKTLTLAVVALAAGTALANPNEPNEDADTHIVPDTGTAAASAEGAGAEHGAQPATDQLVSSEAPHSGAARKERTPADAE